MFDITGFVYRQFSEVLEYGSPVCDLRVDCPKCDDTKKHLYIGTDKHMVHCFRCGYSSSWIKFVMEVTGYSYSRSIGEIYKATKVTSIAKMKAILDPVIEVHHDAELPTDFKMLYGSNENKTIKRYLASRGFDSNHWRYYMLGAAESITGRIIIPIEYGYWQGRKVYPWMEPKYINPKSPARNMIFNASAMEHYAEVVICEGAFSAMAVGRNSIALIGKEPTHEKIERILSSTVEHFIIALEPLAYKTMSKLMDALVANGRQVTVWNYKNGDPNDPLASFEPMEYTLKSKVKLLMNV